MMCDRHTEYLEHHLHFLNSNN
uniref:Uncharacterized protein n=1 Tax=Anguilla anguilla TaxID=7936 RepID=A0A0E9VKQ5_ANGAN